MKLDDWGPEAKKLLVGLHYDIKDCEFYCDWCDGERGISAVNYIDFSNNDDNVVFISVQCSECGEVRKVEVR